MQGWKFLNKNLPDTIFVRVYKERIDLLTAVIIGPQGTPYHDTLFFFDIAYPSNYPADPSQVFYRSQVLTLNPILQKDSFVCLSLLNICINNGIEFWNAASTIDKILVGIQGLVLTANPYYNKPLSWKQKWSWESYNEQVFLLSSKTMLLQLQNPPKNFESFVAYHFQVRAFAILRAAKAYRDGLVRIGLFSENGSSPSSQGNNSIVSRKFRYSMDKLGPQLFEAFSRNGASLQNIFKKLDNVRKKKNSDLFHKISGKLELCLGSNVTNKSN